MKDNSLFKNLGKYKNEVAIIDGDEKITYSELINYTKYIKLRLKKKHKILILIITSNSLDCLKFYISSVLNNFCIILLDSKSGKKFINNTIQNFNPNYIYYPKNFNFKYNKKQKIDKKYILKKKHSKNLKINNNNLILLTTSGTTGSPKFVRISYKNISHNTERIVKYLRMKKCEKVITTLPMAYSYGLSIINTSLSSGGVVFLNDHSIVNLDFWKKIKKEKINSFAGVPQIYEFLKKIKFHKLLPKSIKYLTQAGGKMNHDVWKYLLDISVKNKIKFFSMYGQTEASPRMSFIELTKNKKKICTIGKPLNGTKFKIFKNNFEIKKNYHEGELKFYGKNVSLGYANNLDDLKKNDINKGELFTGDLAYKDKDGFYYITGRVKRFTKIHGLRIDLDDVENFLKDKKIISKALIDDKFLKINLYKKKEIDKVKNMLSKKYKLNKNYIICLHNSNLNNNTKKGSWKNIL